MTTRRALLGLLLRGSLLGSAAIGLGLGGLSQGWAKVKRRLLPKNTDPQSLIYEDPEYLNTQNLEPMPLDDFGTMGDTGIDIDTAKWRLEVSGTGSSPFKLAYEDILELPAIEREVLLICPGVFANHGRWKGCSLRGLKDRLAPESEPSKVVVYGRSRSGRNRNRFDMEEVEADKVFLAYAVNGRPLPRKHGYPLRAVAEDRMGYTWTKYVFKVEFL